MNETYSLHSAKSLGISCKTGLLVSVRSLDEANLVAELGIAILDLKEPFHGPLAPVDPKVWEEVAQAWGGQTVLSAALGEFGDAIKVAAHVPEAFSYAKMGPAGCQSIDLLCQRWSMIRGQLPRGVELVAVAYADHEAAKCPPAEQIFAAAQAHDLRVWLIDTFEKRGASTLDQLSLDDLSAVNTMAKESESSWAIAGSLKLNAVQLLRDAGLAPRWIGVRGDVCDHARTGHLSRSRVLGWLDALS